MEPPDHLELVRRRRIVTKREQYAWKVGNEEGSVGADNARALEVVPRDDRIGRQVVRGRRVVAAQHVSLARPGERAAAGVLRVLLVHLLRGPTTSTGCGRGHVRCRRD